jgi:hypothetical protein
MTDTFSPWLSDFFSQWCYDVFLRLLRDIAKGKDDDEIQKHRDDYFGKKQRFAKWRFNLEDLSILAIDENDIIGATPPIVKSPVPKTATPSPVHLTSK